MSRSDLKEVGELLDAGNSGLIVVAATDLESRVEKALERAAKVTRKQLKTDTEQVGKDVDDALKS